MGWNPLNRSPPPDGFGAAGPPAGVPPVPPVNPPSKAPKPPSAGALVPGAAPAPAAVPAPPAVADLSHVLYKRSQSTRLYRVNTPYSLQRWKSKPHERERRTSGLLSNVVEGKGMMRRHTPSAVQQPLNIDHHPSVFVSA